MDPHNPWKPCCEQGCRAMGYFSHKFLVVLCDRHFFECNGKTKAPAVKRADTRA